MAISPQFICRVFVRVFLLCEFASPPFLDLSSNGHQPAYHIIGVKKDPHRISSLFLQPQALQSPTEEEDGHSVGGATIEAEPLVGFVASVRLVDTDPDRDSIIERRLTDT
jgi:hypothetical protein